MRVGQWSAPLGYDVDPLTTKLVVNPDEVSQVKAIFRLYRERGSLLPTTQNLKERGWRNKKTTSRQGRQRGGQPFNRTNLHNLLTNTIYKS
jgi:site-specific DNA recombinase